MAKSGFLFLWIVLVNSFPSVRAMAMRERPPVPDAGVETVSSAAHSPSSCSGANEGYCTSSSTRVDGGTQITSTCYCAAVTSCTYGPPLECGTSTAFVPDVIEPPPIADTDGGETQEPQLAPPSDHHSMDAHYNQQVDQFLSSRPARNQTPEFYQTSEYPGSSYSGSRDETLPVREPDPFLVDAPTDPALYSRGTTNSVHICLADDVSDDYHCSNLPKDQCTHYLTDNANEKRCIWLTRKDKEGRDKEQCFPTSFRRCEEAVDAIADGDDTVYVDLLSNVHEGGEGLKALLKGTWNKRLKGMTSANLYYNGHGPTARGFGVLVGQLVGYGTDLKEVKARSYGCFPFSTKDRGPESFAEDYGRRVFPVHPHNFFQERTTAEMVRKYNDEVARLVATRLTATANQLHAFYNVILDGDKWKLDVGHPNHNQTPLTVRVNWVPKEEPEPFFPKMKTQMTVLDYYACKSNLRANDPERVCPKEDREAGFYALCHEKVPAADPSKANRQEACVKGEQSHFLDWRF